MPAPKAFGIMEVEVVGVKAEVVEVLEEEGEEGEEREEEVELLSSPSPLLPAMTPNSTTNQ